tara:strand:+ start:6881 stop:9511 length:2631 start_codon:yes stop_codon:yes gene_type:complete
MAGQTLYIRSLKDGVGRQAPSKRLPTEAEELVNCVITVERSLEKRPGTTQIACDLANLNEKTLYGDLQLPITSDDMFHYWFDLTPASVFLLSIDYKGAAGTPLMYVHEVTHDSNNVPTIRIVTNITPSSDVEAYVRHSNGIVEAEEALTGISLGPQVLLLNKTVKAGFSSNSAGKLFDLDGVQTTVDDVKGQAVVYKSASATDPDQTATIWVTSRAYVGGSEVYRPSDGVGGNVYRAKDDIDSSANTSGAYGGALWQATGRTMTLVPVQNFKYPDSSKRYLGQSLSDISEVKLPPSADDVVANNNAETMLNALYPDELGIGMNGRTSAERGKGKIYYFENGYAGTDPGYYIVRSATQSPYLMKIRTPDVHSLPDSTRMPVVVTPTSGGNTWTMETGTYDARISGNVETNPGPSAWKNGNQSSIGALALFRNRLWFAVQDTVFSSKLDDYGNLFLADPSLLVDSDPIDVQLSTNKYAPVTSLTPFESFIFVNTSADIQFSLRGSENQITPYTAELSSASFYSTAPFTDPILMGSQVYFFDDQRLYIFLGDQISSIQQSMEVSRHCPGYLPKAYGATVIQNAYDTLFMVDASDKRTVYGYTNRYQGDQVLQNAFFKQTFSHDIHSMYSQEESIYRISKDHQDRYSLSVSKFREDDPQIIYLDDQEIITTNGSVVAGTDEINAVYDQGDNITTLLFKHTDEHDNDTLMVTYDDLEDLSSGVILTQVNVDRSTPGRTYVSVAGDWASAAHTITWGKNYTMLAILSPQYKRDERNNVIDGVLSIRSMRTRHYNTGVYRVEKTVRGRLSTPMRYSPMELDLSIALDDLPMESMEATGETSSKIFGYASETSISIISDTPNPVNITQIEMKVRFKDTLSSFIG